MPRSNKPKSVSKCITPKPVTEKFHVSLGIRGDFFMTVEFPMKYTGTHRLDEATTAAEERFTEVLGKLNDFIAANDWNLYLSQSNNISVAKEE